jgi:hypothetical protein
MTYPLAETASIDTASISATARVLEELQLYGYTRGQDEPDPRPLPEAEGLEGFLAGLFDAFAGALADTRLEPDLTDLLWSLVHVFHAKAGRVQRELDDNETRQRKSQLEQDGSEVRSVELERLVAEGQTLIERLHAYELMRDRAAEFFEAHTGSAWRPRAGSLVSYRTMTASVIDSRDFLAAKRRMENEPLTPAGTRIAFAGGRDYNDHARIWAVLDKTHEKFADMVLLHGGDKTGAEAIAAAWARTRGVAQIAFKPDFARHQNAAPFKRNDALLEALPKGVIICGGNGIQANLADKARGMGIAVKFIAKPGGETR